MNSTNIPRVGITGGIGSGKSTVCQIFHTALGIPVFYADNEAKRLIVEDPALRNSISALLGTEAYFPDGTYNRAYVAELVFSNPEKLAALNALVHPAVEKAGVEWHRHQAELGCPYTLKEAALMIESGSYRHLDFLIVVSAPESLRIQRVMQRDGFSEAEVRTRISKQMPEEKKLELADFVIINDGKMLLLPQVWAIHQALLKRH